MAGGPPPPQISRGDESNALRGPDIRRSASLGRVASKRAAQLRSSDPQQRARLSVFYAFLYIDAADGLKLAIGASLGAYLAMTMDNKCASY
jgi:hypothetical protein